MKKHLLVLVMSIGLGQASFGQTGIKLGGNLSRFGWSPNRDAGLIKPVGSFVLGFQVGAWHKFVLGDKTSIGLEAVYGQKGDNYAGETTLSNINIPLYLNYDLSDKWNTQLGIAGNYTFEKPIIGYLKPKNPHLGLLLGLGYKTSNKMSINARFEYGNSQPFYVYDSSVFPNSTPGVSFKDLKLDNRIRTLEVSLYYTLSDR